MWRAESWEIAISRPKRRTQSCVSFRFQKIINLNYDTMIHFFFLIEITKAHFNFLFPIGRGGFGKVWRVESKKVKGETFAMKEMCKARVMAKKSVPSVMNELKLLSQLKSKYVYHNFTIN